MRNDIFAQLRDPEKNLDRREILKDRERLIPNQLESDQWHKARIVLDSDKMSVSIDGKAIGMLQSSGIGHPTKTDFGFTVLGNKIEFDDVRAWRLGKGE